MYVVEKYWAKVKLLEIELYTDYYADIRMDIQTMTKKMLETLFQMRMGRL